MVNYAKFSPEYVDSITPVEMQVYWMYYLEDREKEIKGSNTSSGGFVLPANNNEFGF